MTETPLWTPPVGLASQAAISRFMDLVSAHAGEDIGDYRALHGYSVANPADFWSLLWDFCEVKGEKGQAILAHPERMPGASFFPEASLNYAENMLRRTGAHEAIVFRGEDKAERRMSWDDLSALVSRLQQSYRAHGVEPGDRVAAILPNMPEAVAAFYAASSIGAVWSSCSPDFGERGVLDRFGQIEPKILIVCDGYWYAGKRIDIRDRLQSIVRQLPSVEQVIVVPYLGEAEAVAETLPGALPLSTALSPFEAREVGYTRLPFTHPLYILFSSGTTGVPKCIVHGQGGALLQHLKEHRLHCDVRPGDRVFYFTTLGWMMWNWLVSAPASEATLVLYDGSPMHPEPKVLFDYAEAERISLFGTSAKFIDAARKAALEPAKTHDLEALRLIASTGSPLAPEGYDYVYASVKPDVQLASISGGTDLVSCFVLGNPIEPVWRGEIQGPGLGMAVDVWDESGKPCPPGVKGELVCTKPFPTMPIMFWNDPDGAKYRGAYFERFENVWCHGDFAEWTGHGGIVIHGRSDATLNPGGVRIGTAEIYAQVEQLPEILESIAIGQEWQGDVRIVLFVRLAEGASLDEALVDAIKQKIRTGASPRHVPARIVAVDDIPRTKSGKITELAVRDVVHGREVKNQEALANPQALDLYRDLEALRS
ncbi:acetoacetate--CoA ligase [Lutibaculum baratangense]|uniref:Acetoacetyl-CoA synthetase n=1 Tax=Lutibaculum baratangense AMV1 TaxID=631454 RepID=V4RC04_9HYPH|nr:acetoacetate--CoA ligase [Lutibaculum baratangense]ESR23696.1 Acetoacetyl-CoA synthetase [Lutibaculum baratangense AMV1]